MCWAVCCLLWFMLPIFMTQKAGYLLRNEGMGGIRLSKSSVQMLDIVALLLRMRRVNSALTLIFRKKSNLINGKSSLGDGWSNAPSPGSTIPDASAKIMRFPSLLLRLWLKSPISIPYSSAYEYSFLYCGCLVMSNLSLKNGLTPCTCKMHLPPSITASSSVDISSLPQCQVMN